MQRGRARDRPVSRRVTYRDRKPDLSRAARFRCPRPGSVRYEVGERRKRKEASAAPGGEANLPGVADEETVNPGQLAKRLVEEEAAPRGSSEEGPGPAEASGREG